MGCTRLWVGLVGSLSLAIAACGGGSKQAAPDKMSCQGGTYSCVGPGGCSGHIYCQADGTNSACLCGSSSGAQAGTGGGTLDAGAGDAGSDAGRRGRDAGAARDAGGTHDAGSMSTSDAGPAVPPEDCGNGVDDDGDGKIDCADEDCAARTCLGEAPDGWSGPVALYVGADKPPACSGDYAQAAMRGGTGASGDPAQCSTCTCTASSGCASYLSFGAATQSDCSDAACVATADTGCVELSSSCLSGSGSSFYLKTQLPPGIGGCEPSAQTPTITDPTWEQNVLACAPADTLRRGGCSPGNVCAPQGPFAGPYCIVQQGDVACPAGPYSDKRVYYTAINDTRDCSPCSCDSDCSYSWNVYDDADTSCGSALASKTSAGECVPVTPSSGKVRVGVAITGSGGCTPGGGTPEGSAQADTPFTACCM